MYVLVPMIVSMILQSSRWWIFHVGIPHTTWRIHVLGSLSHQSILSGCGIEWWACAVAYSCDKLLASRAILAGILILPIPWLIANFCGNCFRTCKDTSTSNLVQGPIYTFQNHTTIFLEDQSLTNCHTTICSHNAPSLTTLSSCPNPPMTTTHRIFSKDGRDTKLGSPMHPKPD